MKELIIQKKHWCWLKNVEVSRVYYWCFNDRFIKARLLYDY